MAHSSHSVLVTFVYKEDPETKSNLEFFLTNGLVKGVYYHFIINHHICTVEIQENEFVRIFKRTDSIDLAAYKFSIQQVADQTKYSHYFFINSSCRGPFLPPWATSQTWVDVFIGTMSKHQKNGNNNDNDADAINLIAPIIEFPPDSLGYVSMDVPVDPSAPNMPFLHTYMFGCTRSALVILLNARCFDGVDDIKDSDRLQAVLNNERRITACILLSSENSSVKSLLTKYQKVNLKNPTQWHAQKWCMPTSTASCPEVPFNYDGIDLHPYEVVFIKNIRRSNVTRAQLYAGISESLTRIIDNFTKWF